MSLNLNQPAAGAVGWDGLINANFSNIQSAVNGLLSGAVGALLAGGGLSGNPGYLGQGSSGQVLASAGVNANPTWRTQRRTQTWSQHNQSGNSSFTVPWDFTPTVILAFAARTDGNRMSFGFAASSVQWAAAIASGNYTFITSGAVIGFSAGGNTYWYASGMSMSMTFTIGYGNSGYNWDITLVALE